MNKEFQKEFGKKLRELRIKKGLTQEELSFESYISRSHIGMIEQGKRDISLSAIFKLSRALNVDFLTLFEFDNLEKYKYDTKDD
ncbi:MAG: helix-turn-helix transcriptional regulator [Candidatus Gastranaerophilales bacterium]|nr:helix-turn-helix transcriptional regulator [Candidatus Gastranaerophilales bacterium]